MQRCLAAAVAVMAGCAGTVTETSWDQDTGACLGMPLERGFPAQGNALGVARWQKHSGPAGHCYAAFDAADRVVFVQSQTGSPVNGGTLVETQANGAERFVTRIRLSETGKPSVATEGEATPLGPLHRLLLGELGLPSRDPELATVSQGVGSPLDELGQGGDGGGGPCGDAIMSALSAAANAAGSCVPQLKALGLGLSFVSMTWDFIHARSAGDAMIVYIDNLAQLIISQLGYSACPFAMADLSRALAPVGVCLMTSKWACPNCSSGGAALPPGGGSGSGDTCVQCHCVSPWREFNGQVCGGSSSEIVSACYSSC